MKRQTIQSKQHAKLRRTFARQLFILVVPFCFITVWLVASFRKIGCVNCNLPQIHPTKTVQQDLASFKDNTKEAKQLTTAQWKPMFLETNSSKFTAEHLWSQSLSTDAVILGPQIRSNHTLVTAYFRAKSKYPSTKYDEWMQNMMSLKDPLVIFTQPDLVEMMSNLRSDPSLSTIIIPCTLEDLPISKLKSDLAFEHAGKTLSFWEHQLEIDPEKNRHSSYYVFWIWLSKSWLVEQAIQRNFFQSEFFVYTDIGT
jgi:hypothetical protein